MVWDGQDNRVSGCPEGLTLSKEFTGTMCMRSTLRTDDGWCWGESLAMVHWVKYRAWLESFSINFNTCYRHHLTHRAFVFCLAVASYCAGLDPSVVGLSLKVNLIPIRRTFYSTCML